VNPVGRCRPLILIAANPTMSVKRITSTGC
jgi:hypothetical protein